MMNKMNETNKSWFCHLMEVAYSITGVEKELSTAEYEEMEKDGTESVMGAFFSENLTDEDISQFKAWMEGIANRNR